MKVLIACSNFYPCQLGGPANTLYWMAKAFVNKNIDVSVVTYYSHIEDDTIIPDEWNTIDGIKVWYCNSNARIVPSYVNTAKKELFDCDIVMLSSVCEVNNFFVALFAKSKGKCIIWSPRGEFFPNAIKIGSRFKRAYFYLLRLFFHKDVLFHATSEDEKKCINNILGYNVNTTIIPNYIELPTRQERHDSNKPYIVYIGRIAPIKSLEKLIEGLSISTAFTSSPYHLKIVGGIESKYQDYYRFLQTLVKSKGLQSKIEFTGSKSGIEKFQIYADAKFSCLVSESENFGNVVIEALSQGTPVVTSKGTPWACLEESNAGFWIDNSPNSIAECFDKAMTLPNNEYLNMRNNAILLCDKFDVYKNIGIWTNLFQTITK